MTGISVWESLHTPNTDDLSSVRSRSFGQGSDRRSALILSPSPALRDSLQVLLGSLSQLGQIYQAGELQQALASQIPSSPDLVLYDMDTRREETWITLGHLKTCWPRCWCLALVEDDAVSPQAHAAGADSVLLKGIRADHLLDTLRKRFGETE